MTFKGPFQTKPFCDSLILWSGRSDYYLLSLCHMNDNIYVQWSRERSLKSPCVYVNFSFFHTSFSFNSSILFAGSIHIQVNVFGSTTQCFRPLNYAISISTELLPHPHCTCYSLTEHPWGSSVISITFLVFQRASLVIHGCWKRPLPLGHLHY